MSFKEYRDSSTNSIAHEFDTERFAYDVFAYMLRICGFSENKIPISNMRANNYIQDDFVMDVGLSALPIALYSRDEWRSIFEGIFGEGGNNDILEIQNYLESFIAHSGEFEDEDTLSKIQFSLALYNECILFLDFKGIEKSFNEWPKLWSSLCKELIEQSEELDEANESSLTMYPDVSESWISNFIRKFAFPYGFSNDVSEKFSVFTLECHTEETDISSAETSSEEDTDGVPTPDGSKDLSRNFSPKCSDDQEVHFIPRVLESQENLGQLPIVKQDHLVKKRPQARHKNGLKYVLDKCQGKKRSRSQKLEIEDEFGRINFEEENVSPENRDTKRRRTSFGKGKLE